MTFTNFPQGITSFGNVVHGLVGAGNIYYVCQAANTHPYDLAVRRYGGENHLDGSSVLHTTIQSALDATVANRNDYVIVTPDSSDYDVTAALTMSKARTHLIAPAGLGHRGFPSNAVRIHQETAALDIITVSADTVEIAGFFFKQSTGDGIGLGAATRWHPHIHDNFFGMACTDGTDAYGIKGTGAVSHFSIHDNFFTNYYPGAMTGTDNDLGSFIYMSSAGCTRGLIADNIMTTGHNTEVTAGIQYSGCESWILRNYLGESLAHGASQTGILTLGINVASGNYLADNRVAIATAGNAIAGMDSQNDIENWGEALLT